MATANPFDLLGDNDNDDPSLLIAAQQQKIAAKKPAPAPAGGAAAAKLPSKPAPPAQAVKDARSNTAPARGGFPGGTGGGRGGPGRGRGGRGGGPGQGRDYGDGSLNGYAGGYGGAGGGGEESETGRPLDRERGSYGGPRQSYRGGRRGGYGNGEDGGDFGRPRRVFERHSGTGRGNEIKREGSGRGNWGNRSDDGTPQEAEEVAKLEDKVLAAEKLTDQEVAPVSDVNKEGKDGADNENEDKEPEEKEMTLDEYEKLREEKRKALLSMKVEERKVDFDKDFESMQQLSLKKGNDEVFIKLCSDKDSKRKDNVDRDERVKKSVSINQFLKPADGERYYSGGGGRGRGRGRGRGDRGQFMGGFGGGGGNNGVTTIAPAIDDPGHFPTLGGKQ